MSALGHKQTCALQGQKRTFRDVCNMSALPPVADITSLKGMSALCHKWTSCESSSKIKKPRLCLPGHLAFQMPRGRQFEYAPEKLSKSPGWGEPGSLLGCIGRDGGIAAYANNK